VSWYKRNTNTIPTKHVAYVHVLSQVLGTSHLSKYTVYLVLANIGLQPWVKRGDFSDSINNRIGVIHTTVWFISLVRLETQTIYYSSKIKFIILNVIKTAPFRHHIYTNNAILRKAPIYHNGIEQTRHVVRSCCKVTVCLG